MGICTNVQPIRALVGLQQQASHNHLERCRSNAMLFRVHFPFVCSQSRMDVKRKSEFA